MPKKRKNQMNVSKVYGLCASVCVSVQVCLNRIADIKICEKKEITIRN